MSSLERPDDPRSAAVWSWRRLNWWGVVLSGSSAGAMVGLVWLLVG